MLGALFLIPILYFLGQALVGSIKVNGKGLDKSLMGGLFFYHIVFWGVYYTYTLANRSDSRQYFIRSSEFIGDWSDLYGNSSKFIYWVAYPFTNSLGFSYEMAMLLFAFFGYIGFVYFYAFFKENLNTQLKFQGYDLMTILLFLPNMHFWTASLGKGSLIFMGLGMMTYGISRLGKRIPLALLGGYIVYMIRPHVAFGMILGAGIGYILGSGKVQPYQKYMAAIGGILISILMYDKVLGFVGIEGEDVFEEFQDRTSLQAYRLSTGNIGSAVDMSSYPLPMKLFTFWFRPLFIDAPNALGIFVSLENLLYLVLFAKLFDRSFIRFIIQAPAMVKMSGVVFLSISFAMSFVMSNLGIIIRQKSMIMYFAFFVILAFMDWKKTEEIRKKRRRFEEAKRRKDMRLKT
jgi:hypothetical protein